MNVTIRSRSSESFIVPAYFAADVLALESSAPSGTKWRYHFIPKEAGIYNYLVSFREGVNIATSLVPNKDAIIASLYEITI
tara:strand:+ start:1226 stop:1468 length:243 start_codon:yes stop_codon:yes gene_type:complete